MNAHQTAQEQPFVSIVMSTRNRKEIVKQYSLSSAMNQAYPHYEVVVICDECEDGTEALLRNYPDPAGRLRIIRNEHSRGIAHGRNLCAYYARGEIVAFTDDDCLFGPDWLAGFVDAFMKNENVMAAGGVTYDRDSDRPACPAEGIFGFNMAFRKKVFDRFSFDTNLFFHHAPMHEETDLVNRIKRRGFLTGEARGAAARHFPAPASYRRINKRIGDHLNWIYMNAKADPLWRYYCRLYKGCRQMFQKIVQLYREGLLSFFQTVVKTGWVTYVLFVEIPVKAGITCMREDQIFQRQEGANKMRGKLLASCFIIKNE